MKRAGKAIGSTLLTLTPLLIKQFTTGPMTWATMLLFVAAVLAAAYWKFGPDQRFIAVRNPTLDAILGSAISEGTRVHVLQPSGFWKWKKLGVAYSFNCNRSYADHGKAWREDHGLCWKVYKSGQSEWCQRDHEEWGNLGLSDNELSQTAHVHGVLAFPLRPPTRHDSAFLSSKITGVLCFDALTSSAAEALSAEFELMKKGEGEQLLDCAQFVSIYF